MRATSLNTVRIYTGEQTHHLSPEYAMKSVLWIVHGSRQYVGNVTCGHVVHVCLTLKWSVWKTWLAVCPLAYMTQYVSTDNFCKQCAFSAHMHNVQLAQQSPATTVHCIARKAET